MTAREERTSSADLDAVERLLGDVLTTFDDPVHVVDRNLRILSANEAFRQLCDRVGISPNIVGKNVFDAFPFLPETVRGEYEEVFRTGRVLRTQETTCIGSRGVFTETGKVPIPSSGGILRVLTVIRDITPRRRAEAELSETLGRLGRLEAIINRSPAMVVLWRYAEGGPVEYCSPNISQLGYSAEDFLSGRVRWADIVHPEDLPRVMAEVDEQFDQASPAFFQEYRIRNSAGQVRWVNDWTQAVRDADGRITHYQGIILDVTDRRRAETALRQSEERLRAILNSLYQTSIIVYGPDGRAQTVWEPPGARQRYGMDRRDVVGRHVSELLPPDLAAERIADLQEVFSTGRSRWREFTAPLPAGRFHFETVLSPMHGPDGRVTAAVGFVRDVTDRWRAEKALRRARGQITEAREEERRRLAAELHDSVGQELTALRVRLQLAAECLGQESPEDLAAVLREFAGQCAGLLRQVRNLSAGLYPQTLEQLGLVPALRRLLDQCESPQVRCALDYEKDLELARFAPQVEIALFRIAQEATHNALRHAGAGRIDIRLARSDGQLSLAVCDDGRGFDPDAALGAGMGLVSMRERADAIDGTLEVSSRPGRTAVVASVPLGPEGQASRREQH